MHVEGRALLAPAPAAAAATATALSGFLLRRLPGDDFVGYEIA